MATPRRDRDRPPASATLGGAGAVDSDGSGADPSSSSIAAQIQQAMDVAESVRKLRRDKERRLSQTGGTPGNGTPHRSAGRRPPPASPGTSERSPPPTFTPSPRGGRRFLSSSANDSVAFEQQVPSSPLLLPAASPRTLAAGRDAATLAACVSSPSSAAGGSRTGRRHQQQQAQPQPKPQQPSRTAAPSWGYRHFSTEQDQSAAGAAAPADPDENDGMHREPRDGQHNYHASTSVSEERDGLLQVRRRLFYDDQQQHRAPEEEGLLQPVAAEEQRRELRDLQVECDFWRAAVERQIFGALLHEDENENNAEDDSEGRPGSNGGAGAVDRQQPINGVDVGEGNGMLTATRDGSRTGLRPGDLDAAAGSSHDRQVQSSSNGGRRSRSSSRPRNETSLKDEIGTSEGRAADALRRLQLEMTEQLLRDAEVQEKERQEADALAQKAKQDRALTEEKEREIASLRDEVRALKDLVASQGTMYETRLREETNRTQIAVEALEGTRRRMSSLQALVLGLQTTVGTLMTAGSLD